MPRHIGLGGARELMLLGETWDAARAERQGPVNRVVPVSLRHFLEEYVRAQRACWKDGETRETLSRYRAGALEQVAAQRLVVG